MSPQASAERRVVRSNRTSPDSDHHSAVILSMNKSGHADLHRLSLPSDFHFYVNVLTCSQWRSGCRNLGLLPAEALQIFLGVSVQALGP